RTETAKSGAKSFGMSGSRLRAAGLAKALLVLVEGGAWLPYHRRAKRSMTARRHPNRHRELALSMNPHEIIEVDTAIVGCDGGGSALGHPLVCLNLEQSGALDCA